MQEKFSNYFGVAFEAGFRVRRTGEAGSQYDCLFRAIIRIS